MISVWFMYHKAKKASLPLLTASANKLLFSFTPVVVVGRSEEHTSELQSLAYLVCRLLLEKKKRYARVPREPYDESKLLAASESYRVPWCPKIRTIPSRKPLRRANSPTCRRRPPERRLSSF